MSRLLVVALVGATTFSSTPAFAAVSASVIDPSVRAKYLHRYHKVAHRHGDRAPGRNILKYGIAFTWTSQNHKRKHRGVRDATNHEVAVSARQLMTILSPPGPLLSRTVGPPPQAPAGVQTASVRANLPDCTWRPESGGSYTASNPSGAYGKYQIMPEWYQNGRLCAGLSRSPGDQERCAALIYTRGGGAGNWVNC